MPDNKVFTPEITADGSFTFFCSEIGESYHSRQGAIEEAQLKFVKPCQLAEKAEQPVLRLLDICYGLGYNTAAALTEIWTHNPHCHVQLVALELDSTVPQAAIAQGWLNLFPNPIPQLLEALATTGLLETQQLQAQLYLGDARETIQQVQQANFQADAIFLDPFSPPNCPQLWTLEFIQHLAQCCSDTGRLATYSCAAAVRIALITAGFTIGSTIEVGNRQPGTVASFTETDLPSLSIREQEHLETRAAVPYRDPNLSDSASDILHRRRLEQQNSLLEPTSHWKKRWLREQRE